MITRPLVIRGLLAAFGMVLVVAFVTASGHAQAQGPSTSLQPDAPPSSPQRAVLEKVLHRVSQSETSLGRLVNRHIGPRQRRSKF